ncbi:MAG: hypothetical protein WD273_06470 [Trueperaceae bacterium]
MAFCNAVHFDRDRAKALVEEVLRGAKGSDDFNLAYLGQLDYREMEPGVESMLDPFEMHGPVWLVYFCTPDSMGPGAP